MEVVYTIEKDEEKTSKKKPESKIRKGWNSFKNWWRENGDDVIYYGVNAAIIGGTIFGTVKLFKSVDKALIANSCPKKSLIYDPEIGGWWVTNRIVEDSELEVINKRHDETGESFHDILESFGLFKND